jgi:hypothetical protein
MDDQTPDSATPASTEAGSLIIYNSRLAVVDTFRTLVIDPDVGGTGVGGAAAAMFSPVSCQGALACDEILSTQNPSRVAQECIDFTNGFLHRPII